MMLPDHSGSVYGHLLYAGSLLGTSGHSGAASPRSGILSGVQPCLWSQKQASLSGRWVAEIPRGYEKAAAAPGVALLPPGQAKGPVRLSSCHVPLQFLTGSP